MCTLVFNFFSFYLFIFYLSTFIFLSHSLPCFIFHLIFHEIFRSFYSFFSVKQSPPAGEPGIHTIPAVTSDVSLNDLKETAQEVRDKNRALAHIYILTRTNTKSHTHTSCIDCAECVCKTIESTLFLFVSGSGHHRFHRGLNR